MHKKQRFNMRCDAGYFISTRHVSCLLAAFREPFLDAAKFNDEVRAIAMNQGPDGEKTTREWEEFMVDAKVAYNALFRKYLAQIQDETSLIPGDMDVDSRFSTFRTPRKSAVTRLEHAGFGDDFVDKMNRWRTQERAKGRSARRRMNAHYAEAILLSPTTWRGSYFQ
jgi:hypothetical protein